MKIAFLLFDKGSVSDCSHPELGNPGIGGTSFCFTMLMYFLKKCKPSWEIIALVSEDIILPANVYKIKVENKTEALKSVKQHKIDFLVMHGVDNEICSLIVQLDIKVITWGHNFYFAPLANLIAGTKNIVANVFVGKQQYDRYIDHPIIDKSVTIFNMVNEPERGLIRNNDSSTVVYLGSLVRIKGFHLLAKMWKDILKEHPSAKLKVIGTGQLYNRNSKLGKLGIADAGYENEFLPYLTDENGELLKSVEFLGLMGKEKMDVFLNASVGVVNPSARTETFCIGAIEMATAKLPVVTLKANGLLDTVVDKETGFLCSNQNEIKRKIILLLKNKELNSRLGEKALENSIKFSPKILTPQWVSLFETLSEEKKIKYSKPAKPYTGNFKYIRIINRFLRYKMGLKFFPPFICIESWVYSLIRR